MPWEADLLREELFEAREQRDRAEAALSLTRCRLAEVEGERDRAREVAVQLEGTMAQARELLLQALEDPRGDEWCLPPEARRDLVEHAAGMLDFEPLVDVATGEPV